MTVDPGTGLVSQVIERGPAAGFMRFCELARGWVTVPVGE
jgi:hypothetical protein